MLEKLLYEKVTGIVSSVSEFPRGFGEKVMVYSLVTEQGTILCGQEVSAKHPEVGDKIEAYLSRFGEAAATSRRVLSTQPRSWFLGVYKIPWLSKYESLGKAAAEEVFKVAQQNGIFPETPDPHQGMPPGFSIN